MQLGTLTSGRRTTTARRRPSLALTAATFAAALTLTGCGMLDADSLTERALEGAVERATDGEIDIDTDSGQITITDDEGTTATYGASSEIPDDFASAVPVHGSLQVLAVTEMTDDGERAMHVAGVVDNGPMDALVADVDAALASSGWSTPEEAEGIDAAFGGIDEMATRMLERDDQILMVNIVSEDVDAGPHQVTYLWMPDASS